VHRQTLPPTSPTIATPVTRPRPSVTIRSTRVDVSTCVRPVATALARTVLWAPFLASTVQAKPTHWEHCMHAGRPLRGTELTNNGTGSVRSPRRCAPAASACAGRVVGSGGIG
jgi:hypothetical protein